LIWLGFWWQEAGADLVFFPTAETTVVAAAPEHW